MFLGVTSLLLLLGDLRAVSLCWCLKSSKRGTTAGKTKSVQERKTRKETDGPGAEGGLGNCLKHTRSDLPNAFHTDQDAAELGRRACTSKSWLDQESGSGGLPPGQSRAPRPEHPGLPPTPTSNKTKRTQIALGRFFCLGQR